MVVKPVTNAIAVVTNPIMTIILPSFSTLLPDLHELGGARRDRTADLNTASVALSQLSYSPCKGGRNLRDVLHLVN